MPLFNGDDGAFSSIDPQSCGIGPAALGRNPTLHFLSLSPCLSLPLSLSLSLSLSVSTIHIHDRFLKRALSLPRTLVTPKHHSVIHECPSVIPRHTHTHTHARTHTHTHGKA